MTRTALFFGSFNPVHRGHMAIVRYVVEQGLCDELWMVVSPGNPLKEAGELADAGQRLAMVRLAVEAAGLEGRVKVCDIEFSMPRPSYTIDTLDRLRRDHPDREFVLVAGADIVGQLEQWKEHERLLDTCPLLVYPRDGYPVEQRFAGRIEELAGAPRWDYSSTDVRRALERGGAGEMLSPEVADYIKTHNLWTRGR